MEFCSTYELLKQNRVLRHES